MVPLFFPFITFIILFQIQNIIAKTDVKALLLMLFILGILWFQVSHSSLLTILS